MISPIYLNGIQRINSNKVDIYSSKKIIIKLTYNTILYRRNVSARPRRHSGPNLPTFWSDISVVYNLQMHWDQCLFTVFQNFHKKW